MMPSVGSWLQTKPVSSPVVVEALAEPVAPSPEPEKSAAPAEPPPPEPPEVAKVEEAPAPEQEKSAAPLVEVSANEIPASSVVKPFKMMPSVGSWLQKRPASFPVAAVAAEEPAGPPAPAAPEVAKVEEAPMPEQEKSAAPLVEDKPTPASSSSAPANAENAASDKASGQALPPGVQAPSEGIGSEDFKMLPSVGTWLQKRPKVKPSTSAPTIVVEDKGTPAEEQPLSPMAELVPALLSGTVGVELCADAILVNDHGSAVELVQAFKAEIDKKDDEIKELKHLLAARALEN